MKVIDQTKPKDSCITTLNDIPKGTVFRASIKGPNCGTWHTGVFYKSENHWRSRGWAGEPAMRRDVLVVRLDGDMGTCANVITRCSAVNDYEPLDVELVIKGVKA